MTSKVLFELLIRLTYVQCILCNMCNLQCIIAKEQKIGGYYPKNFIRLTQCVVCSVQFVKCVACVVDKKILVSVQCIVCRMYTVCTCQKFCATCVVCSVQHVKFVLCVLLKIFFPKCVLCSVQCVECVVCVIGKHLVYGVQCVVCSVYYVQ